MVTNAKKYFEEKSCPNNNFVILIKRIKMDTAPVKHFFLWSHPIM